MGLGGINNIGTGQVQKTAQPPVENTAPGEGQLGSHTVKPGQQDAATLMQVKSEIGDSLTAATPCERAIAKFLSQTDALGRTIQERLSDGSHANLSPASKSLLEREINRRASDWIDTLSDLSNDGGVSSEDLDKLSQGVVDELKTLVDETFSDESRSGEASYEYRARAAAALGVPSGKTHVYENIGGGSCFFHAALQQLAKSDPARYPVGNTVDSANQLRQALIGHARDLKALLDDGKALGMKTDTTVSKGQSLTHVFARTSEQTDLDSMHPISEGFDLAFDPEFAKYGKEADVSTAALLADYLQRPVTVIAQTGDGKATGSVNRMEFNYGLGSGQKLSGDPLLIYYDEQKGHFMAVDVEK